MKRNRWLWTSACALFVASACDEPEAPTQVMLEVSADEAIRSELHALEIAGFVSDDDGETWAQGFEERYTERTIGRSWASFDWPARLGIVPREGSEQSLFDLHVVAMDSGGSAIVRQNVVARFVPGATKLVSIDLESSCAALVSSCGEPSCVGAQCATCRDGECIEVGITMAEDFEPHAPSMDAGDMDSGGEGGGGGEAGSGGAGGAGAGGAGAGGAGAGGTGDGGGAGGSDGGGDGDGGDASMSAPDAAPDACTSGPDLCDGLNDDCDEATDEGPDACGPDDECVSGDCVPRCPDGVCSGDCVDLQTDEMNCGECGMECETPLNGTVSCIGGDCIYGCTPPFDNCDGSSDHSCETNTSSDVDYCGSCDEPGHACPEHNNALRTCSDGQCGFDCIRPFEDCITDEMDGCETDLSTEESCGQCGLGCNQGQSCCDLGGAYDCNAVCL